MKKSVISWVIAASPAALVLAGCGAMYSLFGKDKDDPAAEKPATYVTT
jgi:hypothetical protein